MRRIRMLAFLVVALGGVSLALPERAEAMMAECISGCWPYCPDENTAAAQCTALCPGVYTGSYGCTSGWGEACGPYAFTLHCYVNIT